MGLMFFLFFAYRYPIVLGQCVKKTMPLNFLGIFFEKLLSIINI